MNGRTLRWLVSLTRAVPVNGAAARGPSRLTILRHHRIFADGERPLYRLGVPLKVFVEQVEFLCAHGLTPISVEEGLRHLAAGHSGHRVALTFDDGYRDNITRALPVLTRRSAHATFYLTAGLMEERRAPWWDEIAHALATTRLSQAVWRQGEIVVPLALGGFRARQRALATLTPHFKVPPVERDGRLESLRRALGVPESAPCELATFDEARALVSAGMEVGGHTMVHPHLTTLDAAGQAREIEASLDLIARRLDVRPRGFAYPGGDYDTRTLAAMRAAGLAHAVTTRAGDNRPGAEAYELKRRGFTEGNCLDPRGRFSDRLALAEIDGAFDHMRAARAGAAS